MKENKEKEQASFRMVLSSVYKMSKNKNMLLLLFYLMTFRIGFQPVVATTSIKLQDKGLPKEIITGVSGCFGPIGMCISMYIAIKLKKG